MIYADYAYYRDCYYGSKISAADYDNLALRAAAYLDNLTGGRIVEITVAVQNAACAVAEAIRQNDEGGAVVSQSVGKWSKTYAASGKSDEARLLAAATLWLGSSGLLCRWC